jgi:carbon monoxide dehydrogenase subunit G
MELVNDFTVSVPIEEAWTTLTDVERIAPCLPGAQLQEIEGDVYRGVVKVKVGPILAQFKGQATFVEKDDANHKAVLKAEGRDTGGKGNASALITAQLEPVGEGSTKTTVTTDLTITGKVAQFGRGALADVSTKLLGQFVEQLEQQVLTPGATAEATAPVTGAATSGPVASAPPAETSATDAPASEVRTISHAENAPVDLVDVAGGAVLKRLAPIGILAVIVVLIVVLRRRRGRD